jgi:ABC-2 type transport system ATP-binding protein
MLHRPALLLLDEPTAGVDPKARRDFWDEIHRLAGAGVTILVTTHYMDEAERCTRLGYIAYGRLLATGTMQEVIAHQHLATWTVRGPELAALAEKLRALGGVSQVTAFGNTLHVTGPDASMLATSLRALQLGERYQLEESATALEDVFIHLMGDAEDNFQ